MTLPAQRSALAADGSSTRYVDAVVVGAGFAGLYLLHRLRGLGLTVAAFDAADDVGGTWWWNRYPGARCDIESMDYSYSFSPELEQEWEWTERYATQPEILRYLDHVAERFDLRRDIRFATRVTAASWEADVRRWEVATDRGDHVVAQFLVMATGCLSAAKRPEIAGIDDFAGRILHTGQWPHEGVDFAGQRVGVIGTGSSGVQSIPLIAERAAHLTVFQRTANFVLPAHNAPLDPDFVAQRKAGYRQHREAVRTTHAGVLTTRAVDSALAVSDAQRAAAYEKAWREGTLYGLLGAYNDLLLDREANETAAEFIRARIRDVVDDPETAELLSPRSYPFGTKRACLDTGYYATFNRADVDLVDVRGTPITEVTPGGIRTTNAHHALDALVFATGFDAMTGALLGPEISGVAGRTLREAWADGPRAYLGLAAPDFPNLFMITGPGSPSVLTNMIVSIEQHVDWVVDALDWMREHDVAAIEATPEATRGWVDHVNQVAEATLYPAADSWYIGANVPGKPRVFMPYPAGIGVYRQICDDVAAEDYRGFTLTPHRESVAVESSSY